MARAKKPTTDAAVDLSVVADESQASRAEATTQVESRAASLSSQMRPSSPEAADRLDDLARVALSDAPNSSEVIAWAGVDLFAAFDLPVIAARVGEAGLRPLARIAASAEAIRNFLVFVPVTLTWVGLGKAGAVYASCKLPGNAADAQAAAEQSQFLYLWQKGFNGTSLACDVNRGQTYGLPLNSFGEVVQADFLILALLVLLTALAQVLWAWHERRRSTTAQRFSDQVRGVLIDCARKLQIVRSVQDTGALVLQASDNLLRVSTDFSRQAKEMMSNLELRSKEAERRLETLGNSYSQVAANAVAATQGLSQALAQVATSADKLSEVSLGVRDDLAKGAAAMENSVKASSDTLGAVGNQLVNVTDAVSELDRNVRTLVAVDETSSAVRTEAKAGIDRIAGQVGVLPDIHLAIVRLGDLFRSDHVQIPVPAWRWYGVLLGGQLLLLVIGVGVLLFGPVGPFSSSASETPATAAPLISPSASAAPSGSPKVSPTTPP